ncbi:histidine utilization repressor [Devosia sp. Root413D1]|nr:histidine utilization repressor [Devosia sp. Root413D1]
MSVSTLVTAERDTEAGTLHQRILNDIEGKIVSGEWPIGHRIPFEVDLAREYGCSRMTVNKVLTQLARAGLIERVKKSGSFVSQPHTQSAVLEISDIRKEVESLKLPYAFNVPRAGKRKAQGADRLLLDVPVGTAILDITCVHLAGGKPFCLEQRLINLASVEGADQADFTKVPPGQWLLSQVPWSSAEHRIHAAAADATTAEQLGIEQGTACLVIERRTWSAGAAVTQVRLTYPGDRHALVATFTPSS